MDFGTALTVQRIATDPGVLTALFCGLLAATYLFAFLEIWRRNAAGEKR